MTLPGATSPVRGLVDAEGRLIEADPRLLELNAHAGGAVGEAVAVPQIATLARLARRLGILVSRRIVAADGDADIDLWVRAQPEGDRVRLAIVGWDAREPWSPPPGAVRRDDDFVRTTGEWRWETDAALRLTFLSRDAGARHGFAAEPMLGQPLTRLFALGEDDSGGLPILAALAMRRGFENQRATIRDTGAPVRLAAVPRSDESGAFAGFIGAAAGLDRPAAEPLASRSTDAPTAAFAARLDRALRLPLARIVANADSIAAHDDGPIDAPYADYAADIAAAGRHLMGLVDDLVDLQAIERADFTIIAEAIDLADVARRAAGLLGVRAADGQVTLDRPAPQDVVPATGEFRRALQVLVNLIGNAIRYAPAGSTVLVHAQRQGDMAAVLVADQGKGIAIEDQARIFEKFARVDPGEPGGSGLGLYIARRLARAMGGDITLDSAAGEGARFLFTLPWRD